VPSPGTNQGDEVRFDVVYPTVFNDTNQNGEIFTFIAQKLECPSYYITEIDYIEDVNTWCNPSEKYAESDVELPVVKGMCTEDSTCNRFYINGTSREYFKCKEEFIVLPSSSGDILYSEDIGPAIFTRECKIDHDFQDGENYKTSPDGWFSIKLDKIERLNMDLVHSIGVEILGSNIPAYYEEEQGNL